MHWALFAPRGNRRKSAGSVVEVPFRSPVEALEKRVFMSAAPLATAAGVDPGADAATALDLGTLGTKATSRQSGTIGAADDTADFYQFTVTDNVAFTAKLAAKGKTAKQSRPALLTSNAAGDAAPGSGGKAAKLVLGPGTYFVDVSAQPAGDTPYTLTLTTKPTKKSPTFTSTVGGSTGGSTGGTGGGTTDGTGGGTTGGTGGGATGGTDGSGGTGTPVGSSVSGTLAAHNGNALYEAKYFFTATETGTYSFPATIAPDAVWTFAPANASGPGETPGDGQGTPAGGALKGDFVAGHRYQLYLLSITGPSQYSITFDGRCSDIVQQTQWNE